MQGDNQIIKKIKTTNKYVNASLVYILANGIGQGTTLLANTFFTRFMSKSEYGMYSTYYSYVAILVPFVGMNLYVGLMNAYMDYKAEIKKVRSSVLLLSTLGLIITGVVMMGIKWMIGLSLSMPAILISLMHAYGFFLVNFYIYSMNMENKFVPKGLMLAVPNVLQALFAGIAVVVVNTYVSRAVGAAAGVLLCGIIGAFLMIREARPQINSGYYRYVLRISLPAIIGSVAAMIMQQCDKVMITALIDAETTAVYALIFNIGYILYAIHQATNGAWQVWLYNTMENKKYENIKYVQKWYLFFMMFVSTFLFMVAPEVIKILSPKSYWSFGYIVPFVVGSYFMIMYSMNLSVVQYKKRMDVSSVIVVMAAIINVVLNYNMIPKFGGVSAAYTSVVSYLFIFLASGIYLKRKGMYHFKNTYFLANVGVVFLFSVIFTFVKDLLLIRYIVYSIALIVEAVYVLFKRNEIGQLFGRRGVGND